MTSVHGLCRLTVEGVSALDISELQECNRVPSTARSKRELEPGRSLR